MECNVPFSLLEPHHCDLTGKTFNEAQQTTSPTPSTKRQRKEKTQKEREKRARRDNSATAETPADETDSAVAAAAATAAASSGSGTVNGFSIKEEAGNAVTVAASTSAQGEDGKRNA